MNEQLALQSILRERLNKARVRNSGFSLRAFARQLGLNSGALSAFLNGKRRFSSKMAARIADNLGLDPNERAIILQQFARNKFGFSQHINESLEFLEISADEYRFISKWHHFAIMSLIQTRDFKNDPSWIAERLGITVTQAEQAFSRLLRLKTILVDEAGKVHCRQQNYKTTDEVVNLSLRQAHIENLDLAKDSLTHDPIDVRDMTAVTIACDIKKLPEAKKRIRQFRDELMQFLESGEQTEVYKFCMQLFPLTKLKQEKK